MNELTAPWFTNLIEDCKDIVVETEFTSRWSLVEGYHSLGARILSENVNFERANIYGNQIVQRVATSLGKKPRTVYYAVKFATLYPDLNLLNEGKNISWHHVINKYLTTGDKPVKISPTEMIKQIKEMLVTEWQDTYSGQEPNYREKCEFIHYLQDQVNKITGGQ